MNRTQSTNKFQKAYDSEFERFEKEFEIIFEKANDKHFAIQEQLKNLAEDLHKFRKTFPKLQPFVDNIEKLLKLDKNSSFGNLVLESAEYETKGNDFLVLIAVFKAHYDFVGVLNGKYHNYENLQEVPTANITCTLEWSTKLSQRDFAKLFYALNKAGLLKGEITKIIPEVAKALNFNLGNQWQANISKGKSKNNFDFEQDKIFDTLKIAFNDYYSTLQEKQMKKTE